MKKILHFIHGLNLGGAENFIFNLLKAIDSSQYRFDFVIQEPEIKHTEFKKLIEAKGGNIYLIPEFMHNPFGHARELKRLLKRQYDFVHIHMNALINPIPVIIASNDGCRVIIHSHSTKNGLGGAVGKYVHKTNRQLLIKKDFIRLACSTEAGRWMFGNHSFQTVPNAIDINEYCFREEARRKIREQYNLKDEYVIGQVGRLIPLKNQSFSLKIFNDLRKKAPHLNAKLMIVGDGPDKLALSNLSEELDLSGNVIFTGSVLNVCEYYSAFDCFIMPSFFEGLALVAVEAQASGLKPLVSDTVTKEINITGFVKHLSLENPRQWVEALIQNSVPYDRQIISGRLSESPFDSNKLAALMQEIYN